MITLLILIPVLLVVLFFLSQSIPGTSSYLGWKVSGIWANQSDTLQIIIHEEGTFLNGHIVSAQVSRDQAEPVVGKMIVDHIEPQPVWKWSSGKYIDPYTRQVLDLKIKLKNDKTLKVCFVENDDVVRKEEWKLVNSF